MIITRQSIIYPSAITDDATVRFSVELEMQGGAVVASHYGTVYKGNSTIGHFNDYQHDVTDADKEAVDAQMTAFKSELTTSFGMDFTVPEVSEVENPTE